MQLFEILEVAGEVTPTQLAKQSGLTTGGVTAVLARLESARLIQREPNPRDRRSILVRATPEGLALLRPIYGKMNEDLEHQLALYNVKNLDVLIRFFRTGQQDSRQTDAHLERFSFVAAISRSDRRPPLFRTQTRSWRIKVICTT